MYKPAGGQGPYAYVRSADAKVGSGGGGTDEPWHWHTKQRKMMRAEVADAFKLRRRVLVVMVAGAVGWGAGSVVLGRWVLAIVRESVGW